MSDFSKLEAALEQHHEFPGAFDFKVIGANTADFEQNLRAKAETRFPGVEILIRKRESSKGRHASFTLTVVVPSARSVCDLYDDLRSLEGLKMLL